MDLTAREAGDILGISERALCRLARRGDIPATRVRDQYRFHRAELLEWVLSRNMSPPPALLQDQEESAAEPLPSLAAALRAGGIHYEVAARDRTSALRALVGLLPLPDSVDRDALLSLFRAREELASTGLGEGLAIPHVRNPLVLRVDQPLVTLCFLAEPVDFQALDGKPVFALFSLVTPTVRVHLHLLSRLAYALQDWNVRDAVTRRAPPEELLNWIERVEAGLGPAAAGGAKPAGP
jgi:PTS system nitrogen regulatory IIA component